MIKRFQIRIVSIQLKIIKDCARHPTEYQSQFQILFETTVHISLQKAMYRLTILVLVISLTNGMEKLVKIS